MATTVFLSPIANDTAFYANGVQLSGGKLYTYAAGSTTPLATYTDNTGNVQNANPIILNSEGYPASAGNRVAVWLRQRNNYKFILQDAISHTLWTLDNITGINDVSLSATEWISPEPSTTLVNPISDVQFTLTGDQTPDAVNDRWVQASASGTLSYGIITGATYAAGLTTITVVKVSGTMSAVTEVKYGLLRPDHTSIPLDAANLKAVSTVTAEASINIWRLGGNLVHVSGATAITTSMGQAPHAGARRRLIFDSGLTITHNGTTLVCPNSANLTVQANDVVDVTADTSAKLLLSPLAGGRFPGEITDFGGSIVPAGWLECDGASLLRADFTALFTAITTTWGAADGTHFNLPDLRGRARLGRGTGTQPLVFSNALPAANAIQVGFNDDKWITGMPFVVTGSTGFTGVLAVPDGTTVYLIRVDSTHIGFAATLAAAQNGTLAALATTGSATLTHTLFGRAVGLRGGDQTHAMSATELLAHTHPGASTSGLFAPGGGITEPLVTTTVTGSTGGNAAMSIMPPFGVTMTIIKT